MANPEREARMENIDSKGDNGESKKRKKKRRSAESSDNEKRNSSANAQDFERADDNELESKKQWKGAVLSILDGAMRAGSGDEQIKVKKLRKLVLLSLQQEDSDKAAKNQFMEVVQGLEEEGELTLDEDGMVARTKTSKKRKAKEEKDSKKKKKKKHKEETTEDDGDGAVSSAVNEPQPQHTDEDASSSANDPDKNKTVKGNPQCVSRIFLGNKRSRPLAGKVIAVTTLAESSAASCPENFTNVMTLCKEAGAKTSNQVHKKTFCLLASEAAVAGETQRVRKAWKKGIPVVDVAWVRQCVEDDCLRPFGEFLVGPDSSKRKRKAGKGCTKSAPKDRDAHVKDDANPLREEGWSESVDLGCCCVCHETGVTDCEWCVECSVNTAAKVKRQLA
jgi:hypothetical protein